MTFLLIVLGTLGLLFAFFAWANGGTQAHHARFRNEDVEHALVEFLSPDTHYLDDWDMFLAWPIDDPYLESIRKRCIEIDRANESGLSPEAIQEATAFLEAVRDRRRKTIQEA